MLSPISGGSTRMSGARSSKWVRPHRPVEDDALATEGPHRLAVQLELHVVDAWEAGHGTHDLGEPGLHRRSDAFTSVRPRLEPARRVSTFDEVVQGLYESTTPVRGPALHVVRQLLRVRQLPRRLPRERHPSSFQRGLRDRPRPLQGLRAVFRGAGLGS
jgi:hypothetical protein